MAVCESGANRTDDTTINVMASVMRVTRAGTGAAAEPPAGVLLKIDSVALVLAEGGCNGFASGRVRIRRRNAAESNHEVSILKVACVVVSEMRFAGGVTVALTPTQYKRRFRSPQVGRQ